ncbi:MAG: hypothetical protein ABJM29_16185 [Rhizobiaceae bacterium]
MKQYQFPNRYTELSLEAGSELQIAIYHVARKVADLWCCQSPRDVDRRAPIFGEVEVNRITISEEDQEFLANWHNADHADITYAWTLDGPFYRGEIWQNEPELIIAEVYKIGDQQEDAEVHAFIHDSLLFQPELASLANKVLLEKMTYDDTDSFRSDVPVGLLSYRDMIANWPAETFSEIEQEMGEFKLLRMSSVEIDSMISKKLLNTAIGNQ